VQAVGEDAFAGAGRHGGTAIRRDLWSALSEGTRVLEVGLALWAFCGWQPGWCAIVQTAVLVALNVNGLLWARQYIHEPLGMVVKNTAFLVLVWVCGAVMGGTT
jgi:hypothetical protein